jgi:hypothetical protein
VEAQHRIATRKLVDSLEDQALLESLLEESKPPRPEDTRWLDYLLATPFRYPPLRHGSRFGGRAERGIWYGAEAQRTVFAEAAYYRLLFLEGTAADLDTLEIELTVYRVSVSALRGLDLCAPAFERYRVRLASPGDYRSTQALGRDMRAHGVQAFRYPSARDPAHGPCVGVLDPSAFAARRPGTTQSWHCFATRGRVEFLRHGTVRASSHRFEAGTFHVAGALPAPAT